MRKTTIIFLLLCGSVVSGAQEPVHAWIILNLRNSPVHVDIANRMTTAGEQTCSTNTRTETIDHGLFREEPCKTSAGLCLRVNEGKKVQPWRLLSCQQVPGHRDSDVGLEILR
jgi:hypothetical protein